MTNHLKKISKYKPSIFQAKMDFAPVAELSFGREFAMEQMLLRSVIALLIALACVYLYLVTASVLNVMARREAMSQITAIQGSIGQLEQQYFALTKEVSPSQGASLGLSPVAQTSYVYSDNALGAATIARNEI